MKRATKTETAPKPGESVCAGCGKPIHQYSRVWVTLADGKEYRLCSGRSYQSASDRCYKLALEKLAICPGCGKGGETAPGRICSDCKEHVALGRREAKATTGLAWYGLDHRAWAAHASPSGRTVDLNKLMEVIADAVAPGRKEVKRVAWRGGDVTYITPDSYKHGYISELHGVEFQATPEQAAAIKTFLECFGQAMNDQRTTGRQEGRSILVGLASGKLNINSWDEKNDLIDGKEREDEE